MAFSQAQLDALDAAIAVGALTVEWEGQKVTYRSLSEMLRVRKMISAQVKPAEAGSAVQTPVFDKGL